MVADEHPNPSENGASPSGPVDPLVDIKELIAGLTGPAGDVIRELAAEGYEPDPQRFAELRTRAATWPE